MAATVTEAVPLDTPIPTDTATLEPQATDTPEPIETSTFTPSPTPLPGEVATVVAVIDGDTIDVEIEGETHRLRYIGMDTPERGDPFFDEATSANEKLVDNQIVYLVKDVSETDQFGRLLRYVYLEDGTFVNAELVRLGYALVATYPPDVAHEADFLEMQQLAREQGAGLWGLPTDTPIPPTNIPIPPTNTPALPTNTPSPPTNTPVPPTNTPVPVPPTNTPEPAPEPGNVQITSIFFDGIVPRVESDEYAQITNLGGSVVNLSGWHLNADDAGQDFWFPSFDLQPGQNCRVYTNEIHPEHCGFSFGSGQALWNNSDRECGHLYDANGAEVSTFCY